LFRDFDLTKLDFLSTAGWYGVFRFYLSLLDFMSIHVGDLSLSSSRKGAHYRQGIEKVRQGIEKVRTIAN
jgi:hypothetical protein